MHDVLHAACVATAVAPNPWMQLPVRLKDLQPKKDGTVDLVISLHMKELFQVSQCVRVGVFCVDSLYRCDMV